MNKQQIAQDILKKYNITGYVPNDKQPVDLNSRFAELDSIANKTMERELVGEKKRSIPEKIAGFTGGEKLAQGIATSISAPIISKNLAETTKLQSEAQDRLIAQIQKNKAEGKDNTNLINALQELNKNQLQLAQGTEKLLNPEALTGKQIVGDVLQLGTTIAGAGTYGAGKTAGMQSGKLAVTGKASGALSKALPFMPSNVVSGASKGLPSVASETIKGTGIVKGAMQGAKTGAIAGGAFGASTGVSSALKEDKSALDIAKSGLVGAGTGAVAGGVLGGVTGGISGGIKQAQANKLVKEETFGKELVMPKETSKVKVAALKEGRVTEQGLLKGSKILPSKRDERVYDAVKDVVSSKFSPIENIDAISNKVEDINSGVKAYITENKVPFNTNQIKTQLNKGKQELNLVFASDKQAEKTYNAVVKEFMKHIENKDTLGVFEARQSFDKVPAIKKLLDSQGLGENAKKEIILTVRDMANQYVAKKLPEGNSYRTALLKESNMINAIKNIAEKNTKIIGKSKLIELFDKYPVLKGLTAGLGLGVLGSIGIGNAIVRSTD